MDRLCLKKVQVCVSWTLNSLVISFCDRILETSKRYWYFPDLGHFLIVNLIIRIWLRKFYSDFWSYVTPRNWHRPFSSHKLGGKNAVLFCAKLGKFSKGDLRNLLSLWKFSLHSEVGHSLIGYYMRFWVNIHWNF